ncbi:MAG: hypothetical protein ISS48_00625 [Candidatus Aenigmarchaeota archaeon]|nr:hypothetical protein [Candidatus Aenigmarchaeota archaeon]
MPKWIAWFTIALLMPVTLWVEYEAFFGKEPNPTAGIVTGFIMIGTIVMMLLMAYKKLPYMLIEEK